MQDQPLGTPLECGTGIINVFKNQPLAWTKIFCEFADNAFGADARKVTFRKEGKILTVEDNGEGCDNLRLMESPAKSITTAGNKASKYGIGGVMSQINASRGTEVEVESRTSNKFSSIRIDWQDCLEKDRLAAAEFTEKPLPFSRRTGTIIKIHNCKRIQDAEKVARELGYRYSKHLAQGHAIGLEVDGSAIKIKPYAHPAFSRKVDFQFSIDGQAVTGFCGLVPGGIPNPFPGWSIHWGYRFFGPFGEPSDGRPINRIYSEVYLPRTWQNIGVTKDDFSDIPDALWLELATHCREIIEAADAESRRSELSDASREAELLIGMALTGKRGIKGARPGKAGKSGTVIGTGQGSPHQNFPTASQLGDKAFVDSSMPTRSTDSVRIVWDGSIEEPYAIQTSGLRGRVFSLTLNSSVPQIADFKDHPKHLATLCLGFVAKEISEGSGAVQKQFPAFRDLEYKDVYKKLLARLSPAPKLQAVG